MYYSNGNYEAFARPKKPEGVDHKSAYLIGSGLASLSAAAFLVRDGQMKGDHIHILEELELPGGGLDGIRDDARGFIIRGGREMENHFECLWDLFRSIPSLEVEDASVLDEFYWLNKEDPNKLLSVISPKLRGIPYSPPNTPSVRLWKPSTRCWTLTGVSRRYSPPPSISGYCWILQPK